MIETDPEKTGRGRIVVALSGGGRTFLNLCDFASRTPSCPFEIVGVIASRPCKGIEIAKQRDLAVLQLDFKQQSSEQNEDLIYSFLQRNSADYVALAGYLRKFPVRLHWQRRVVNIHPALLPSYGGQGMYGMRVHEKVIASKDTTSGATVHFANNDYDDGPILGQAKVPRHTDDTVAQLADRVFHAECELYPRVLCDLVKGNYNDL